MRRRTLLGAAAGATAGLAGCLAATEYTVADVSVDPEGSSESSESSGSSGAPLAVDATVLDPNAVVEGPARLEFALANAGDAPVRVRNTGIWPFGVLRLSRSSSPDDEAPGPRPTLWTDAYAESPHMDVDGRHSFGVSSTPLTRTLDPGATAAATYEVHGDDLPAGGAGAYYVYGKFEPPLLAYAPAGSDDFRPYRPTITVGIERKRLLPVL